MIRLFSTFSALVMLPLAVSAQEEAPVPAGAAPLEAPVAVKKSVEGGWLGQGNKIEDTPSKKSKQGFGASLVVVRNEAFFAQWEAGKGGTGEVAVPLVKQVSQIAPFWVVIFTTGAGVDGSNCDVTFDVSIKRPDESEFKKYENLTACKDTKQDAGVIYLSQDKAMAELTLDEPVGSYSIDAVVRDKIKQVELKLYRPLEVIGSGSRGSAAPGVMKLPLTEKKVLVDDQGNPVREMRPGEALQPPAMQQLPNEMTPQPSANP